MNTNFTRSLKQQGNQNQNKKSTCAFPEGKTILSKDEHYIKPLVKIMSEARELGKSVSKLTDPTLDAPNSDESYQKTCASSSQIVPNEFDSVVVKEEKEDDYVLFVVNNAESSSGCKIGTGLETNVNNSEKEISDEDDIYILVVDDDGDNSCGQTSSGSNLELKKEINSSESEGEDVSHYVECAYWNSHICKRCGTNFSSVKLLKQHIERRSRRCTDRHLSDAKESLKDGMRKINQGTGEQTATCAKCHMVFKNKRTLKKHITTVCYKEERANSNDCKMCDICGMLYTSSNWFQAHMNKHQNLGQFKCSECDSRFTSRSFLERHIAKVHRKTKLVYHCNYCSINSESKEHIRMHEQVHTLPEGAKVPEPYRCDVCDETFISKHALRAHKENHTQKNTKLKCPLCSKVLANSLSLNVHLEAIHTVVPTRGEKAIRCDQCDRRYSWFGSYVKHKLVAHNADVMAAEVRASRGPQSAACDICGREFKCKSLLNTHRWYHHSETRRMKIESSGPVPCDQCHRTFKHKFQLTKHKFMYHRPRDPSQLACRVCHKQFTNYSGLWSHNKYVHVQTSFDCVVCGSKFKRKSDYLRHLRDKHSVTPEEYNNFKAYADVAADAEAECDGESDTITVAIGPDIDSSTLENISYIQF